MSRPANGASKQLPLQQQATPLSLHLSAETSPGPVYAMSSKTCLSSSKSFREDKMRQPLLLSNLHF